MVCQQLHPNSEAVGCPSQPAERAGGSWLSQGISCRQDSPNGPWGLSYFCFCSPVSGPGDKHGNQLWSLTATEEPPAWGGRDACGLSEMVSACGLSLGQLLPGPGGLGGSQA